MRYAAILGLLVSLAAQNSKPQDLLKRADKLKFSDRPKAEELIREALSTWDGSNPKGPDYADAEVFLSLLMIGSPAHRQSELKTEVQPLVENAISIYGQASPPISGSRLALALEIQAHILHLANHEDLAKPVSERAKQIRAEMINATQNEASSPSSPPPPVAQKMGGGVSPPSVVSKVEPRYSDQARAAKIQGTAVLGVIVRPDGIASEIHLLRSLGFGLDEEAVEAVRKWRFKPGMKDGEPVNVYATIEVNFRLL